MTDYVAAFDGGGTKTLGAFASREGNVRLTQLAAGCNPQDNPHWRNGLSAALMQLPAVSQVVLGLPGYGEVPAIDTLMRTYADDYFTSTSVGTKLIYLNDVELAYRGAFPDGDGVLLLAGTGSMAMSHGPQGLIRAGGWGDLFGDEGSAFWIGQRGLQLASQMRDGRIADTGFADRLSKKLGILPQDGLFGLSIWATNAIHPRSHVANVSIYINDLSEQADVTAQAILDAAATELVAQARSVIRLAQMIAPLRWTHSGAVFRSARVLNKVSDLLGSRPVTRAFDALGGGLWMAALAAGWPVDAGWAARIRAGLGQKATS